MVPAVQTGTGSLGSPLSSLALTIGSLRVRLIDLCLSMDGLDTVHAADGESGLEVARNLLPDAIILDIALPEINGWEVFEQLRSDPVTEKIPVLVATTPDSAVMLKKADAATAEAFIGEPFDLNALREALGDLLER